MDVFKSARVHNSVRISACQLTLQLPGLVGLMVDFLITKRLRGHLSLKKTKQNRRGQCTYACTTLQAQTCQMGNLHYSEMAVSNDSPEACRFRCTPLPNEMCMNFKRPFHSVDFVFLFIGVCTFLFTFFKYNWVDFNQ